MKTPTQSILAAATMMMASAASTSCLQASPLLTLNSIGPGYSNVPMQVFGSQTNEYAVALNVTVNGVSSVAFCVDLLHSISVGSTYANVQGAPVTLTNGQRAAWIYVNYAAAATNAFNASALQLALWDVVHDNGDGFAQGNIRMNATPSDPTWGALVTAAGAIVTASAGKSSNQATILYNTRLDSGLQAQTLITGASAVPSPEPSACAMLGVAAVGAWRALKRRTVSSLR